jgi:hypothetical protein
MIGYLMALQRWGRGHLTAGLGSGPGCCWEPSEVSVGPAPLRDVYLASVEIDQPQLWTAATPRLGWSHSTDVRREIVLPGASADLGHISGVAAFRRPGLVAVFAVVPKPGPHPLGEARQVVAVPFLQGVAGERMPGAPALVSQDRDLVH